MFREMLRKTQQLSDAECIEILERELRGVLSVMGDGDYPYGIPMNHFYCEESGKIYFHCGRAGHKLDAIRNHEKVCFCVYDQGNRKEKEWALTIKSVIVFGRMCVIDAPDIVTEITRKLCYKFTQDEGYIEDEIRQYAAGTLLLELTPEHMTGKTVKES